MRNLQFTDEFLDFINSSEINVRAKIAYLFEVIKTQTVINSKIAKKLINTNFYEIRIQVNNEYRIIIFTIDHDNINQSKEIVFLNGFMKKSTKDYDKQIKKSTQNSRAMERIKINIEKLKKETHSVNDYLDNKYGKQGTPEREEFSKKALSFYYGELIKEKRKEKNLTQQQLADQIGKERAYIAKIEQGKTDLQISNFVQIINALGLSLQIA